MLTPIIDHLAPKDFEDPKIMELLPFSLYINLRKNLRMRNDSNKYIKQDHLRSNTTCRK